MQCQAWYDLFDVMESIIRSRLKNEPDYRICVNPFYIIDENDFINGEPTIQHIEHKYINIWNSWNCNTIVAAINKQP